MTIDNVRKAVKKQLNRMELYNLLLSCFDPETRQRVYEDNETKENGNSPFQFIIPHVKLVRIINVKVLMFYLLRDVFMSFDCFRN